VPGEVNKMPLNGKIADQYVCFYALHIGCLINDVKCKRCAEGLTAAVNQTPLPVAEKN
jgi:hypothetical protein